MSYLIDTNVLFELSRAAPNDVVANWLGTLDVTEAYLSVVTIAEIRRGISVSRDPVRTRRLELWLEEMKLSFEGRILPIDTLTAELGGSIEGKCQLAGRPAEPFDALIAATAEAHGLIVVTRNIKDFEVWGGPVFDPWTQA